MKKNVLYTINNANIFNNGGLSARLDRLASNYYGALDYGTEGHTAKDYLQTTNKFGISKANNPFSKVNLGKSLPAIAGAAGGIAGSFISNGYSTGAGKAFNAIGDVAAMIPGPWGAVASAGAKVISGLTNAAFGTKVDQAKLDAANAGTSALANYTSDANYFDDIQNPMAQEAVGNVYKGGWFAKGKARRKNEALQNQRDLALDWASRSVDNNVNNIIANQMDTALANYAAKGGKINIKPSHRGRLTALKERTGKTEEEIYNDGNPAHRKMVVFARNARKWDHALGGPMNYLNTGSLGIMQNDKYLDAINNRSAAIAKNASSYFTPSYAFGGELGTNGADFTNGLLFIDEGNTHENNPLGGVPMGIDGEGNPNLVEEGETIFNDYVFSDRLKVPDSTYNELGLGGVASNKGISFAAASKKLAKESEQRPNDPISMNGLQDSLARLAAVQEAERMKEHMKEYVGMNAYGGNLFAGGGNMSEEEQSFLRMILGDTAFTRFMEKASDAVNDPIDYILGDEIDAVMGKIGKMTEPQLEKFFNTSIGQRIAKTIVDLDTESENVNEAGVNAFGSKKAAKLWGAAHKGIRKAAKKAITLKDKRAAQVVQTAKQAASKAAVDASSPALTYSKAAAPDVIKGLEGSMKFAPGIEHLSKIPLAADIAAAGTLGAALLGSNENNSYSEAGVDLRPLYRFNTNEESVYGPYTYGLRGGMSTHYEQPYFTAPWSNYRPSVPSEEQDRSKRAWFTQVLMHKNNSVSPTSNSNTTEKPVGTTVSSGTVRTSPETLTNNMSAPSLAGRTQQVSPTSSVSNPFEQPLDEAIAQYNEALSNRINNNNLTITKDDIKTLPSEDNTTTPNTPKSYATWMRYAPAVGSGIMTLTDALGLTNKPDYTYADKLEAAANAAGYAPNISSEPVGDYLTYRPYDTWFAQNAMNAQSRATDRALMNNGSVGSRAAGLLANGYNSQIASGNMLRQAQEYNDAQRERVADFNRKTNMFNSQMGLEAAMANARYRQQAANAQLSGLAQAAGLREGIDARIGASRSANITNFLNSLGNIGRENFAFNQINSDASRRYKLERDGDSYYLVEPEKKAKGGKFNRKKK